MVYIQVKNSRGEYITVPHVPEALQVNIGGVMQRWTADKYIAPVSIIICVYQYVCNNYNNAV